MNLEPINYIEVGEKTYCRQPIKTHLIDFGEDLLKNVKKYVQPHFESGDWLAISEKVVSVCQNKVRHISTVKVGWLAKLLVKGVKKYPQDIGFSRPEKMQVAVDIVGHFRMIIAMIIGGIGKLFGVRGVFWKIAGNHVSELDGFVPDAMPPYDEWIVLPPNKPQEFCQKIEDRLEIPTVIIDGNNINVEVIAGSNNVPLSKELVREILLDNPMGQDDEKTPFILIKNK